MPRIASGNNDFTVPLPPSGTFDLSRFALQVGRILRALRRSGSLAVANLDPRAEKS